MGYPIVYVYTFTVWPAETFGFSRNLFLVFEFLNGRIERQLTADEFETFRSDLNRQGLTLREILRQPAKDWELIK